MERLNPNLLLVSKNDHHYEHGQGEKNHHKITTFTLNFPHALDLNRLVLDLNEIVKRYRGQVYRIKGFIAIPNYPNRVILQSARSAIIATDGTPWEDEGDRVGKLVFIGRGLKKETFDTMLGRHMPQYGRFNKDRLIFANLSSSGRSEGETSDFGISICKSSVEISIHISKGFCVPL